MGDFDGDLVADFFYARAASGFEIAHVDANTLAARIVTASDEQTWSFRTTGTLTVEVGPAWRIGTPAVLLGAWSTACRRSSAPIGLEPSTNTWTFAQNSTTSTNLYLEYRIRSTQPITDLDVSWNRNIVPAVGMRRILHDGAGGYLVEEYSEAPSACVSS